MASALREYMQTYGSRLQSMLHSPVNGSAPAGAPLQPPPSAGGPASQLPGQLPGPQQDAQAGSSFGDLWQRTSEDQRKQFTDQLEATLKRGNQTIDSAYDEMIAQLGQRPSGKLSREDKGALLIEFGLTLMANSAAKRYGGDLGAALGASGLQTLGRYQQMTRGRQNEFDAQVGAINAARSKAKSALAEKLATEGVKGESELAKTALTERMRGDDITGTVTAEGGEVYGYTKRGRTSALKDEQGRTIKERQKPGSEPLVAVLDENGNEIWVPRSEAAGRKKRPPASQLDKPFSMKAADTNAIYRQAAGLFGGMFDPLTGRIAGLNREQSETVQAIAARASQIYSENKGEVDHATAVERAFEEIRSGQSSASSDAVAPDSIPPNAPRKTMGGKSYVKIGDTWYEEG